MGNTYTAVYCHVVFSTKHRKRWLARSIENRVWSYLASIVQANRLEPIQIGGVDDHVHLLFRLHATTTLSKLMQILKGGSSTWIHEAFPDMQGFSWQDGYGAFSVSQSQVPAVVQYIRRQREHHRVVSFEEEFRKFLQRHRIPFDERHLWD